MKNQGGKTPLFLAYINLRSESGPSQKITSSIIEFLERKIQEGLCLNREK